MDHQWQDTNTAAASAAARLIKGEIRVDSHKFQCQSMLQHELDTGHKAYISARRAPFAGPPGLTRCALTGSNAWLENNSWILDLDDRHAGTNITHSTKVNTPTPQRHRSSNSAEPLRMECELAEIEHGMHTNGWTTSWVARVVDHVGPVHRYPRQHSSTVEKWGARHSDESMSGQYIEGRAANTRPAKVWCPTDRRGVASDGRDAERGNRQRHGNVANWGNIDRNSAEGRECGSNSNPNSREGDSRLNARRSSYCGSGTESGERHSHEQSWRRVDQRSSYNESGADSEQQHSYSVDWCANERRATRDVGTLGSHQRQSRDQSRSTNDDHWRAEPTGAEGERRNSYGGVVNSRGAARYGPEQAREGSSLRSSVSFPCEESYGWETHPAKQERPWEASAADNHRDHKENRTNERRRHRYGESWVPREHDDVEKLRENRGKTREMDRREYEHGDCRERTAQERDGTDNVGDDTKTAQRKNLIRLAVAGVFSPGCERKYPWLAHKNGKISMRTILDTFPIISQHAHGNVRSLSDAIDGHQGCILALHADRSCVRIRSAGEMFRYHVEREFLDGTFGSTPQNISVLVECALPKVYVALYEQQCTSMALSEELVALLSESPYLDVDDTMVSLPPTLHLQLVKVVEWVVSSNDIFEPAILCPNARSRCDFYNASTLDIDSRSEMSPQWISLKKMKRHPYVQALDVNESDIADAIAKHSIMLEMNEKRTMVKLRAGSRPNGFGARNVLTFAPGIWLPEGQNQASKHSHALRKQRLQDFIIPTGHYVEYQNYNTRSNTRWDKRRSSKEFSSTSMRRLRLHLQYYFEDPSTNRLLYNLIRHNIALYEDSSCFIQLSHLAQIGRVGSLFQQTCGSDQAAMIKLTHLAIGSSELLDGVVSLQTDLRGEMVNVEHISEYEEQCLDLRNVFVVLAEEHIPFIREWATVRDIEFDARALVPSAECRGASMSEVPALPNDVLLLMQYNISLTAEFEINSIIDDVQTDDKNDKMTHTQRVGRLRREIAFHHCDVIFLQHSAQYVVNAGILPALLESVRTADSCDITAEGGMTLKNACQSAVLWNAKKLERVGSVFMYYDKLGSSGQDQFVVLKSLSDASEIIDSHSSGKHLSALGLRRRTSDDVLLAVSGYLDYNVVHPGTLRDFTEKSLAVLCKQANVPLNSIQVVIGISEYPARDIKSGAPIGQRRDINAGALIGRRAPDSFKSPNRARDQGSSSSSSNSNRSTGNDPYSEYASYEANPPHTYAFQTRFPVIGTMPPSLGRLPCYSDDPVQSVARQPGGSAQPNGYQATSQEQPNSYQATSHQPNSYQPSHQPNGHQATNQEQPNGQHPRASAAWPDDNGVCSLYERILDTCVPSKESGTNDHLMIRGTSIASCAVLRTPPPNRFTRGASHACLLGAVKWSFGAFLHPEAK